MNLTVVTFSFFVPAIRLMSTTACARVIGAPGLKVPSGKPCTYPALDKALTYFSAQWPFKSGCFVTPAAATSRFSTVVMILENSALVRPFVPPNPPSGYPSIIPAEAKKAVSA
ncbi:hypothetical protein D3C75_987630 [compost metagenome]